MLYLVTYDVPEQYNPIRTRIAAVLKNYGLERLQFSVFIGELTPNQAETVSLHINDILGRIEADVRMFPICERCYQKLITIRSRRSLEPEEVIVL
jgi:CRISPR-associated protein Cas2